MAVGKVRFASDGLSRSGANLSNSTGGTSDN